LSQMLSMGGLRQGTAGWRRRRVLYTCWHPWVKGLALASNSQYNHWRLEDAWLDK